jgi:hypothetical protein
MQRGNTRLPVQDLGLKNTPQNYVSEYGFLILFLNIVLNFKLHVREENLKGHSREQVFEIIPFNHRLGPNKGTRTPILL